LAADIGADSIVLMLFARGRPKISAIVAGGPNNSNFARISAA
jgi:hypothetical protein